MNNKYQRKKIMIFFICILFIQILLPITLQGKQRIDTPLFKMVIPFEKQIIYVDDDNVNGPWYGTLEHPFQSIRNGVEYAFNGDTVFVFNGTYTEGSITIYNSINLIGENRNTTIINGAYHEDVIDVLRNNVNISEFTIKKGLSNGIFINSNNNIIKNTIIIQCRFGINFWGANNNIINGNIIEDSGEVGLLLWWSCNYNNISYNIIRNQNEGIRLVGSQHSNVVGHNYLENNSVGINFWDDVQQENICDNVFFNNGCGISLGRAYNLNILGNTFVNNSNGIISSDITYNNISSNSFLNNNNGIYLKGRKNTIKNNNFIKNSCDVSFTYYNIPEKNYWNHNYWDRPRLLPKPIRGTLLIQFMYGYDEFGWLNFDWFPALKPYDIGG